MVHLHNVSGGVLGGDRLELSVGIGPGARAQITTTGATRIYRPCDEAPVAYLSNEITVGENALLEYVPDALIPFAGARLKQCTTIRLEPSAGLFWWEILAPGREARGEVFEYANVELRTDVVALGKPIALERIRLEPNTRDPRSVARLKTYRTWATFCICRVGIDARIWLELESELRGAISAFSPTEDALWGVSVLPAHGLAVRCVARTNRDILSTLQAIWSAAKLRLYGRSAELPRKVN